MEYMHITHTLSPVFNEHSRVLILGTMPSPKSREKKFYYAHPQNRFWKVISAVRKEPLPQNDGERVAFLKRNGIALWDTIQECDIIGAADSSIKNVVPTDLSRILSAADIKMIFTTGQTAYKYYCRFQREMAGIDAICLPSTSPANARKTLDMLIQEYNVINNYL